MDFFPIAQHFCVGIILSTKTNMLVMTEGIDIGIGLLVVITIGSFVRMLVYIISCLLYKDVSETEDSLYDEDDEDDEEEYEIYEDDYEEYWDDREQ